MSKKKLNQNGAGTSSGSTADDHSVEKASFLKSKYEWMGLLLLFGVTFMLYANTFHNPFIFDDTINISQNYDIRMTDFSVEKLKEVLYTNRPVAMLSFALNYYFDRLDVVGYRVVNVIIHILTGALLYIFLKLILSLAVKNHDLSGINGNEIKWISFFTVTVWLLHPLQTQSVTYLVQRMNSMAAMFYLLSLICYIHARTTENSGNKIFLFIACAVSGLLALGSKENAAILPVFIFLFEWYFFQDLSFTWLKKYAWIAVVFALLLALAPFAYWGTGVLAKIAAQYERYHFTMGQRLMTEMRVVIYYLSLLVFPLPARMNLDYQYPISHSLFNPITTLSSLICLLAAMGFILFYSKKYRLISFCMLWYLGNLLIESSVIPLDIAFEHRLYLPCMLILLLFVIGLFKGLKDMKSRSALICLIAVVFSVWTYQRNQVWADVLTFWQDNVNKSPNLSRPRNNLALALYEKGKLKDAITQFKELIRLNPNDSKPYNNLGNAYSDLKDYKTAIGYFEKGLKINPDDPELYYNYGNALMDQRNIADAIVKFQKAIELKPKYPKALNNLGYCLAATGKIDEAIEKYKQALHIDPESAETLNNYGLALMVKGYLKDAISNFQAVIKLKPDNEKAYNNLGLIFEGQGKTDTALECYKKAIALNSNYADGYYNLGNYYRKKNDFQAAIKYYQTAVQKDPYFADARFNLGNVYTYIKEYDKAMEQYKQIIKFNPDYADAYNNLGSMYAQRKDFDKAMAVLEKARKLKPKDTNILFNIGIVYEMKGDVTNAALIYQEILKIDPKNKNAASRHGQIVRNMLQEMMNKGDYKRVKGKSTD